MISIFKRSRATLALCIALFVVELVLIAIFWDQVPEPMPIHWDLHGQADRFAARWLGLSVGPLMTLGLPLLILGLTSIDPKRRNVERSNMALDVIVSSLATFSFALHTMILRASMTPGHALEGAWVMLAVGALLVILGNMMPKFGANFFIGVRTPWALSDDVIWLKTQRLGAKLMVIAGAGAIFIALMGLTASKVAIACFVVGALLAAFIPMIYSYLLWRQKADVRAR